MSGRVPFVVDACRGTFERLDELLGEVCGGLDGSTDIPPPQDRECVAVAALNLLNLQVCSITFFQLTSFQYIPIYVTFAFWVF